MEQAHSPQSVFCSVALCTMKQGHSIGPKELRWQKKMWGPKQDLVIKKTTDFISKTHLQTDLRQKSKERREDY